MSSNHEALALSRQVLWRTVAVTILAIVVVACCYGAIRSRWYASADGAFRSLEVYGHQQPFLHGNNHLLFPLVHWLWWQAAEGLGVHSADGEAFLRQAVLLNVLAAAVAIVVYWRLLRVLGAGLAAAALAAVIYGATWAFLAHATTPTEPMLAMPFVWLSLVLAMVPSKRRWWAVAGASALCAGLAVWFYQGMVIITPAIALAFFLHCDEAEGSLRVAFGQAFWWCCAFVLAVAGVFLLAHACAGDGFDLPQLLVRMVTLDGSHHGRFGGLRPIQFTRVLAYGATNLVPLPNFGGLRGILQRTPDGVTLSYALASLVWLGTLAGICFFHVRGFRRYTGQQQRMLAVLLAGFLLSFIGPVYWIGNYDKLWILPFGFAIALLATGLAWDTIDSARRLRWAWSAYAVVGLGIVAVNLTVAVQRHFWDDPYRSVAQRVAVIVDDKDLLVEAWDPVSIFTRMTCFPRKLHRFSFWEESDATYGDPGAFRRRLHEAVDAAAARGGKVIVIGLLDVKPQDWLAGIDKSQYGAPYEDLDILRSHARVLETWTLDADRRVTLFHMDPKLAKSHSGEAADDQ